MNENWVTIEYQEELNFEMELEEMLIETFLFEDGE